MDVSRSSKLSAIAIIAFTLSAYTEGATVKVNCNLTANSTISTALKTLNPGESNTVEVSGHCKENVLIQGFDRLTLISTTGASIQDASNGINLVVEIDDSRRVTMQGFTINGGLGVQCENASVCYLTGNTVQSSAGDGLALYNASTAFLDSNVIQNNAVGGLSLHLGSTVFSGSDTFRGNMGSGIRVVLGSHLMCVGSIVQNNGSNGSAAVFGGENSALRFDSCTINGNASDGVLLGGGAEARFAGSDVVTGNGGSGVSVNDLSFALFQGAIVTGNLGGTDVLCNPQFSATRGALTDIGGGKTNCVEPAEGKRP